MNRPVSRGRKWLSNNSQSVSCLPSSFVASFDLNVDEQISSAQSVHWSVRTEPRIQAVAVRYGRVNSLTNKLVTFRYYSEVSTPRRSWSIRRQPDNFATSLPMIRTRLRTTVIVILNEWLVFQTQLFGEGKCTDPWNVSSSFYMTQRLTNIP